MAQFLPFHIAEIGEDEIQSVIEALRSGWLTTEFHPEDFPVASAVFERIISYRSTQK